MKRMLLVSREAHCICTSLVCGNCCHAQKMNHEICVHVLHIYFREIYDREKADGEREKEKEKDNRINLRIKILSSKVSK